MNKNHSVSRCSSTFTKTRFICGKWNKNNIPIGWTGWRCTRTQYTYCIHIISWKVKRYLYYYVKISCSKENKQYKKQLLEGVKKEKESLRTGLGTDEVYTSRICGTSKMLTFLNCFITKLYNNNKYIHIIFGSEVLFDYIICPIIWSTPQMHEDRWYLWKFPFEQQVIWFGQFWSCFALSIIVERI